MAKPKKRKKKRTDLPKNTKEWEALSDSDLIAKVFGPEGQQRLTDQALTSDARTKKDYRLPTD